MGLVRFYHRLWNRRTCA